MWQDARVMIAGGGLGGLCLAQGLRKAGIPFTVFERDEAPFARPQGYRLSITPDGLGALHANLPAHLWAEIERDAVPQSDDIPFVDPRLRVLFRKPLSTPGGGPLDRWVSIDRVALRRTLLEGLDQDVVYSKRLAAFEDADDGRVACRFSDGTAEVGDLLVGADGTRSVVREGLLDGSNLIDTGIVSIAGQLPYDDVTARDFDPEPLGAQAVVLDREPQGLFMASHRRQSGSRTGAEDYVFWALLARRERFPEDLERMAPADLKRTAQGMMGHWHERLLRLVERTQGSTMQAIAYETSVRPASLPAGRVAILGDAIHNMPPTAGQGANMALRDARALTAAITAAVDGPAGLTAAVARFHGDMLGYAFTPVEESMANMAMMVDRESQGWGPDA